MNLLMKRMKWLSSDDFIVFLVILGVFLKIVFPIYLAVMFFSIIYFSLRSWKKAWLLFLIGVILGAFFEVIGVLYGFPFGSYYYDRLNPKMFGVALYVPIMWGIYSFLGYLAARYYYNDWRTIFLTGIFLVVIDLALDPIMVSWNAWVWITQTYTNWFGIPFTNYVGWFFVTISIVGTYKFITKSNDGWSVSSKILPLPIITELFTFWLYTLPNRYLSAISLYALVIMLFINLILLAIKIKAT